MKYEMNQTLKKGDLVTKNFCLIFTLVLATSCASYNFAHNVKSISFDDFTKGKALGNVKGQDCMWTILGYKVDEDPSMEEAFINAKKQSEGNLRYINNVSTNNTGFNAGFVRKDCLGLTGVGSKS